MTLEELRQQFIKLQTKRLGDQLRNTTCDTVLEIWANYDVTDPEHDFDKVERKMIVVARSYVLMRDQGVSAALLYKLQAIG